MTGVRQVGVVVPAHDEEERLPACLAALRTAAAPVDVPVEVVVVLDSCTDGTARVAAGVRTVTVAARSVGVARAAGFTDLLARHPPDGLWLATTDADTVVPGDWLARQLRYAAGGDDAVLGTVQVADWSDHPEWRAAAFARRYHDRADHPHVHGANLGVRASAYLATGGMPALALSEDVAFVAALHRHGARIRRAGDIPVVTSARRRTRAAGGFGDYLQRLTVLQRAHGMTEPGGER